MNQFRHPVTKTFSLFPAVFTQIEVTFAFTHTEQFWCRRVPNFDRYVLIQTNQIKKARLYMYNLKRQMKWHFTRRIKLGFFVVFFFWFGSKYVWLIISISRKSLICKMVLYPPLRLSSFTAC